MPVVGPSTALQSLKEWLAGGKEERYSPLDSKDT
jgi:hypothetical protein